MDSLIHFEEYEEYIDESLIGEGYIYVFYYVFEYANWYVFFAFMFLCIQCPLLKLQIRLLAN